MTKRLSLAVLLSGGGTTLANILSWQNEGRLLAGVDLVVSSTPKAGGLEVARKAGIRTEIVDAARYTTVDGSGKKSRDYQAMSGEINRLVLGGGYDLVCMAGFLCRYYFDDSLRGRVLNIHPSLIPMFCGQGMYGHRVHEAVVGAGVRISGCTVHLADHQYDTGPIILQRCCPVYGDDTAEDVARRVFREECLAYPEAINVIAEGRLHCDPRGGLRMEVDGDRRIERFSRHEY